MNRNKNRLLTFIKILLFQILSNILGLKTVFAEGGWREYYDTNPIIFHPKDPTRYNEILGSIYNLLYPVAITYGILQIIFAGYRIMKSEGEPKAMAEAKEHLTDSIIGIVFVILAVIILRVIIKSFFGSIVI